MTLFDRDNDLPVFKRDRLLRIAQRFFPDLELTDDYLWGKLLAEEAVLERELRTWFSPRMVYPQGATQAEIAGFNTDGLPTVEEPGYDYDGGLFSGSSWGFLPLRQKQVGCVYEMRFAFPDPRNQLWVIPADWIRVDRAPGRLNIVPTQVPSTLPLNSYLLQVLSGGMNIPFMLQVFYRAGIENVKETWPDLVDLVYRCASLAVINDEFLPSSSSVSADGLSQSISVDASKYEDLIDARKEKLSSKLNGIMLGVC